MENPEKFVFFITTLAFDFFLCYTYKNGRPVGEKFHPSALVYDKNDSDTQTARDATRPCINRGYSSWGNNCSQVISDGINAEGGYLARSILPGNAVADTVKQTPFLANIKYRYPIIGSIAEWLCQQEKN